MWAKSIENQKFNTKKIKLWNRNQKPLMLHIACCTGV